jgi:hypothetical protein
MASAPKPDRREASRVGRALLAGILVALAPHPAARAQEGAAAACDAAPVAKRVGLQDVWVQFRAASLAGNLAQVMPMVRFPLAISGVLDADSQTKLGRSSFPAFFQSFMDADSGSRTETQTVRDFISAQSCVADTALNAAGDSAQIGPMVFAKNGAQWQLVQVFMDID